MMLSFSSLSDLCLGGGGKGREAKGGHASIVTYAEASEISDLDAYWASLDQCVGDLKDHLIKHLTLRSAKLVSLPRAKTFSVTANF